MPSHGRQAEVSNTPTLTVASAATAALADEDSELAESPKLIVLQAGNGSGGGYSEVAEYAKAADSPAKALSL